MTQSTNPSRQGMALEDEYIKLKLSNLCRKEQTQLKAVISSTLHSTSAVRLNKDFDHILKYLLCSCLKQI